MRGISIKLQEEERERRDQYVPDVSALEPGEQGIVIDAETRDLLKEMGFGNLPHLQVAPVASGGGSSRPHGGRGNRS